MRCLDLTVSAVLLAGLYAAMAFGLGLIYGVLRVVNLAHGGIIMAAAYVTWLFHERLAGHRFLPVDTGGAPGHRHIGGWYHCD